MALGDAILACLTEHPMTGYELAKTFDASIGFFWKADHQQIYRELSRAARPRPYPGPRGGAVRQAQQAGLHPHPRGPGRAAALGRAAKQPGLDQGRSAGAALRARQRRHRAAARRPDGAHGTPPRPLRPLRTHPATSAFRKAPPRPPIPASCCCCGWDFAMSAAWRSGARRRSRRLAAVSNRTNLLPLEDGPRESNK